jgi:hypothetical protein
MIDEPLPSRANAAPAASRVLELLVLAGCLGGSTLAWLAVCVICDHHEAWDRAAYFVVVMPLLSIVSALAAWLAPQRAWRWPAALALGQLLGLGITTCSAPSLGPLALVAVAVKCALFSPPRPARAVARAVRINRAARRARAPRPTHATSTW